MAGEKKNVPESVLSLLGTVLVGLLSVSVTSPTDPICVTRENKSTIFTLR